ncbi:hypothetical protein I5G63_gp026 [Mycobacterium phage Imvubu]|uniref:Uncharacterized protein n=1 Tax=Mycobacterium phage Imvubu TaxID=2686233 RepID=A0A6B9L7F6_9CAUD|nr:hypothetical protein I5G63_gp026 [Mycobacterium phage Imvubu]QHB37767.1 hypothetical protein PBI_IMVUBU_26 [Mycobacterium phage Imvubu]
MARCGSGRISDMMEAMTQPDPSDPTFDPAEFEWALGYEYTSDPLGLADDWEFIYQSMPYELALENYRATSSAIENTPGGIPNIRNLGVYFTPPVTWQPFDVPPAPAAEVVADERPADTPNQ